MINHDDYTTSDPLGNTVGKTTTSLGLGARAGVNVPFDNLVSLWLRAAIGFSATFAQSESAKLASGPPQTFTSPTRDSDAVSIELSAPLLLHASPHAFVGFGPYVYHELTRTTSDTIGLGVDDPEGTTVGASLTIGGWL